MLFRMEEGKTLLTRYVHFIHMYLTETDLHGTYGYLYCHMRKDGNSRLTADSSVSGTSLYCHNKVMSMLRDEGKLTGIEL